MTEWKSPAAIAPLGAWPSSPRRGRWAQDFRAVRGDQPANLASPFYWSAYLDGELVASGYTAPELRNYDRRGGHRLTVDVDTTRWPDGVHELLVYGYPVEPEPDPARRWHAAHKARVTFANGPIPMALLPSVEQCVVHDDAPVRIGARVLHCDGSLAPAGPVALSTARPDRVHVVGDTLALRSEGWATVTVAADGLRADIRVARYPAGHASLPHLGRDWSVKRAWEPRASRFVVAPFYQSIDDAMRDPALAARLRAAGLSTFWSPVGDNIGTRTLAEYQQSFWARTNGYWDFLAAQDAEVHLVFDGIARTRGEARASLDNPDAAAAYQWAIEQWTSHARGFGIRVIDEVAALYGDTPTPTDRRWDHLVAPTAVTGHDGTTVRLGARDLSRLPAITPPAAGDGSPDRRPRFLVRTGAHAGKACRVARGDTGGRLTLATDAASLAGGFDPRSMRLARGDRVLVLGWSADPATPLPDDALRRVRAMLTGGPAKPPVSFPPPAHAPGYAFGRWLGFGTYAEIYNHVAPGNDRTPLPTGYTLPQGRAGFEHDWFAAQDHVPPSLPVVGLVTGAGAYYTKRSNRRVADFDPKVDEAHLGTGRALYTSVRAALALVGGACGISVYFFDNSEVRRQRTRETHPRSVLGEPLQTGFHPDAPGVGGETFRALAAFVGLLDTLGERVFRPMGMAPALGPGLRASRRGTGRGSVLLVVNTRELPVTSVSLPLDASAVRWRLVGPSLTQEAVRAGAPRLTLAPGELTALVMDA